jgi:hypothetical protein
MALRAFRFLTFEEYKKLTRAERNRYVAGVTEELMRGGATGYGLRVTGYTESSRPEGPSPRSLMTLRSSRSE